MTYITNPDAFEKQENTNDPHQSDAQKLSAKHMADEHHVISDEEMQGIRIGVAPLQNKSANPAKNAGGLIHIMIKRSCKISTLLYFFFLSTHK